MRILPVLIILVLGACGREAKETGDPIGESYHESLDKAGEVEAIVEERADAIQEEIDAAEGN